MSSNQAPPAITSRDLEVLMGVFQSTKEPIVIDYAKLAEKANFKNVNTSRVIRNSLRKKLDTIAGKAADGGEDGDASPEKGKKAPAKKRKGAATDDDEDGVDETPAKKGRKTAAKKGKKTEVEDGSDEEVKAEVKEEGKADEEV